MQKLQERQVKGREIVRTAKCPSVRKKGIVGESQEEALGLAKLWTRLAQDKSVSHWLSLHRPFSSSQSQSSLSRWHLIPEASSVSSPF